ncbi:chromosomal replication initiator protein DnaA [Candidatus Saccharibacteria bacterium]|nr:chromosomal replication initiator protein DnaA [Candidatus Saccharibacteria bacterium]
MFDVWKNVMAEIEQKVSRSTFVTWFDDVSLVDVADGVVKIGAPNPFKRTTLEKKYGNIIEDALRNNNIEFTEVRYVSKPSSTIKKRGREVVDEAPRRMDRVEKLVSIEKPIKENHSDRTGLNNKYTLDSFVTGTNNDLAVSVAKSVISSPGTTKFNPFFLYGGPGLGKTHLVQAIGNEILRDNPRAKILYIPINRFYQDFISTIQKSKDMESFRQKYLKLDVLIIDDFQLIVGKEKSQEEFFDIFNELYQKERQLIVTSDRLPSELKTVDERLASRLTWAGPVDIQMPSFEDRCAILKSKAEFMGADIEDEAIEYLADNVKTNIRDLEGELNRLLAVAELRGVTPLELIGNNGYTQSSTNRQKRTITAKQVVSTVASFYDLSVEEMCGKSRVAHIKNARQVAMYLLSEELSMSTTKIALEVGVKDHTTVMHGIKKIREDLKSNFGLHSQIAEIKEKLYE